MLSLSADIFVNRWLHLVFSAVFKLLLHKILNLFRDFVSFIVMDKMAAVQLNQFYY